MKNSTHEKISQRVYCAAPGTSVVALPSSSTELSVEMDLFQHRYYRLNKTLMALVGFWPYQSTYTRVTRCVILIFILTSQVVPQMLAFVKYRDDKRIIMECLTTFLFEAICLMKLISWMWNVQKARKLLDRIRTDWQVWAGDQDANILHKYAEQGRKMAIVYTVEIYAAVIVYVTQPILPTIIDVLLKNGTAPRKFPFPVDFYRLDMQKYYWYIIMHTYICVCAGFIISVATEIMLIVYVQHVCGIFAALGQKFQRIGNSKRISGRITHAQDMIDLSSYIDRHTDATNYADLVDATYSWTIFFVIGCGMILLNVVGLQILMIKNDPEATVRYIGITLSSLLYVYVECDISEILIYRSISIHLHIYKSQWYNLTPEAQKHLQLMMMLCHVPCQLTAGKYVTLSMTSFGQMVKTALSYFTFVRSMHTQ